MNISPAEALRIYNVSKPTLYKHMDNGTVSFTLDDTGKRRLNPGELDRLYKKREGDSQANSGNGSSAEYPSESNMMPVSLFEKIIQQQKEQYEKQVETLEKALEKAQSVTLMIETSYSERRNKQEEQEKTIIESLKEQITELKRRNTALNTQSLQRRDRIQQLQAYIRQLPEAKAFFRKPKVPKSKSPKDKAA